MIRASAPKPSPMCPPKMHFEKTRCAEVYPPFLNFPPHESAGNDESFAWCLPHTIRLFNSNRANSGHALRASLPLASRNPTEKCPGSDSDSGWQCRFILIGLKLSQAPINHREHKVSRCFTLLVSPLCVSLSDIEVFLALGKMT